MGDTVLSGMDRHLEKALDRLEAAVKALEGGGAGDDALRGEIAEIRAMIGEAMELLDGAPGRGGA